MDPHVTVLQPQPRGHHLLTQEHVGVREDTQGLWGYGHIWGL